MNFKNLLAGVSFVLFNGTLAFAGAKNAIAVGSVNVIKSTDMGWRTIIPTTISTSMNKALQINVSLECGLYTNTVVKSQNMVTDTSSAYAGVDVQVLIDGKPASPGVVTFCNRMQQLTATLQGALLSCTDILNMSSCTTTPEVIGLLQETMSANAFNFALIMPTGTHQVEVQARIHTDLSFQNGSAGANATIGKGAVTVEEVNLIPSGNNISF
ncbi:MAG: hypothetical protein ACXVB1_17475 [Pseudobdellovibrionaceae bacterium]